MLCFLAASRYRGMAVQLPLEISLPQIFRLMIHLSSPRFLKLGTTATAFHPTVSNARVKSPCSPNQTPRKTEKQQVDTLYGVAGYVVVAIVFDIEMGVSSMPSDCVRRKGYQRGIKRMLEVKTSGRQQQDNETITSEKKRETGITIKIPPAASPASR